jgi:hypothetical protein
MHFLEKTIKIPLLGINKVIADHFNGKAPNFLSIDAEGFDLKILRALDWSKYRPDLICAETLIFGTLDTEKEIYELLEGKGYIVRGCNFVNTIFVDKRLLGKG